MFKTKKELLNASHLENGCFKDMLSHDFGRKSRSPGVLSIGKIFDQNYFQHKVMSIKNRIFGINNSNNEELK